MTHKKYFVGLAMVLTVVVLGCKSDALSRVEHEDLISKGTEIAGATFAALSSELQQAMMTGGVPHAVRYCNLQAMPITDSLSTKYNAVIRRTSDKVRNPKNKATAQELKVIQSYKDDLAADRPLEPQVVGNRDESTFYAPILTNTMCLKCHGSKQDIASYAIIEDLYPDDLATDYVSGQVRGIWSIKFSHKSNEAK